ncbi:hypothetical protein LLE87_39235, partial [Paenibacillus polymyxa]|nr:hypothetical protein [Paenibacillus polymyxa]
MRLGRISAPTALPSRAERLQQALAARGVKVEAPSDYGRKPLEHVHSTDYLGECSKCSSEKNAFMDILAQTVTV